MHKRLPATYCFISLIAMFTACRDKSTVIPVPPSPGAPFYTLTRNYFLPTLNYHHDTIFTTNQLRVRAAQHERIFLGSAGAIDVTLWMASKNKTDDSVQITLPLPQLAANNWVGTYRFKSYGNCQQCPVEFYYHYRRPAQNILYSFELGAISSTVGYGNLVIDSYDAYYHVVSGRFTYTDKGKSTPSLLPIIPVSNTGYWYPLEINLSGTFTNVPIQQLAQPKWWE